MAKQSPVRSLKYVPTSPSTTPTLTLTNNNVTKYKINLQWSERDEAWIASVPELPGCMADGKTPAAALEEVGRVIKDWIEEAQRIGNPVPAPMPSIDSVAMASPYLNTAAIARAMGLAPRTLRARIAHRTPLRDAEAEKLRDTLSRHKLVLM